MNFEKNGLNFNFLSERKPKNREHQIMQHTFIAVFNSVSYY